MTEHVLMVGFTGGVTIKFGLTNGPSSPHVTCRVCSVGCILYLIGKNEDLRNFRGADTKVA